MYFYHVIYRGKGKSFFLRLLKKCLDPDVVEDPHTLELHQLYQRKAQLVKNLNMYNEIHSGITCTE